MNRHRLMAAINEQSCYMIKLHEVLKFILFPRATICNRPGRALGTRIDQVKVKLRVQERAKRERA